MSLISVFDVSKSFAVQEIFSNVTFKVENNDKIGIVGVNGAGKTTLFKILTGEEDVDSGSVFKEKDTSFAYMEQHADYTSQKSALEEVESIFSRFEEMEHELNALNIRLELFPDADWLRKQQNLRERYEAEGGLTYKSRCRSTLIGLGFKEEELSLPMEHLSGGQRTRVLLAKILLSDADILLLDEPTNHLDIESTRWLEDFLIQYRGSLMIISHDRYFLDRVCGKIFEIENRKLTVYPGNYTKYRELKTQNRIAAEREYEKKQKEIKRIEGIIEQQKRFNQERNYVTIKSKQKQIDRLEDSIEKPEEDPDSIKVSFTACSSTGNDALILDNLSKSFGERTLFENVNVLIKSGRRCFLTGANGCGKTTLFRIILGELSQSSGEVKIGSRVKIGYYDQNISHLNMKNTIFDEISDSYPRLSNTQIRSALGVFLFRGDDVFKEISKLSGGERARVELAKLMLSETNFLMLDEPTNHLDIASKEALEDALKDYEGTMLVVSHDRYFIKKLSTQILDMHDGTIDSYDMGYEDFLSEKEKRYTVSYSTEPEEKKNNEYKLRKQADSDKRKTKNRLLRIEKEIEEKEHDKSVLEASLSDPDISSDYVRLKEVTDSISALSSEIESLFDTWTQLSELSESQNS